MHVRSALAAAALTFSVGAGAFSLAGPASAQEACDAYSGTCTEPAEVLPTTAVLDEPPARTTTTETNARPGISPASSPTTLPFTGGELVLFSALGAGAVAGGVALVVIGRRRSLPTS